jgi:hypothetical protein
MNLKPINIIVGTRLKAKLNGNVWVVVNKKSKLFKYSFDIRLAASADSKIHEDLSLETIIDKFEWYF